MYKKKCMDLEWIFLLKLIIDSILYKKEDTLVDASVEIRDGTYFRTEMLPYIKGEGTQSSLVEPILDENDDNWQKYY